MDEKKAMSDVLDVIHDEATRLLAFGNVREVEEGLRMIQSLARYKQDLRTTAEKARSV